ncbi:hypothetical protein MNBD_NITROSPINAE02-1758 [hydrothermal vent metagenome]|uniref:Methyltransferase type 11 domain-containing protein n=1 Tax=hydrothermal vent metagenome TaxID=652676 RepID=A0A3B1BZG9_9ZZZZ
MTDSKDVFLQKYLSIAPIPLGLVRAIDCKSFDQVDLTGSILDVGCGDGVFASILMENKNHKIEMGIDFDIGELVKAKRQSVYKNIVNCDTTNLPVKDSSYDTVISNSVFEHIPNLDGALSEISRILKPGGRFIITIPSHHLSDMFLFTKIFNKLGLSSMGKWYSDIKNKAWKHYHLYSPETWVEILSRCGLRVVEYKYLHSKEVTELCDLFSFSGVMSVIWRKLFSRLLLFPFALRGVILSKMLGRLYKTNPDIGATIFLVAEKEPGSDKGV